MISGRRRRLRTGLLGLARLLVSYRPASSFFLAVKACTLLWRLWTFSELRTCLITDRIHRCRRNLVVRQRCDTQQPRPKKGCGAVITAQRR